MAEELSYLEKLFGNPYLPIASLIFLAMMIILALVQINKYRAIKLLRDSPNPDKELEWDVKESTLLMTQITRVILVITSVIAFGYLVYVGVKGTPMQGHLMEWLNIIIRWAHVVAGVMWIGASFYFVFLENNLNRTKGIREELAGNLWAIHGGGFYFLEKYKVAPKEIPKELHWFKYEAYFFRTQPRICDLAISSKTRINS